MPQNIGDNRIIEDGIARIKPSDADRLARYRVRAGDIVYSRRGDVEKRALIREPESGWLCGTGCLRVRLGEKGPDPRYASFYLAHPSVREWIVRHAHGATMPNLNTSILGQCPFIVPPLDDQKSIAEFLGALDDKIELNHQTNETLEALALALFKDWFVDFGPTRTEAEGGAPYLAPELWALFPDALDDEDKPVGWNFDQLGYHIKAIKGLSYKGGGLSEKDGGLPLHNLNSVLEGGGYKHNGLKYYSGDHKERHLLKTGDLIVTNTEQGFDHLLIGYAAKVPKWTGSEGLYSHHLFKITLRAGTPLSNNWFYLALNSSWIGDAVRRYSNGTTVNMLPNDAFVHPRVLIPSSSVIAAFDDRVSAILGEQERLFEESQTLAQTRDLLLPKLMSGEIRLRDAEREVEAVL